MKINSFAPALLALLAVASSAEAIEYKRAEITKIVDGREVFIDNDQVSVGAVAPGGSTLRTGRSRARLLFDPTAIGLMGPDTMIKLGQRCFRSERGRVLVNGKILACLGRRSASTKMAGSRGTTYLLETTEEGHTISVLVGEVLVGTESDLTELTVDPTFDIQDRFPSLNPSVGLRFDGFTYTYPKQGKFGMEGVNAFIPIYQSEARKLAYSYTAASSDFDDYWAVSTEFGYRWLTASNRSSTGVYLGYGGYDSPSCYNSLLNLGGQWAKDGWTYGMSSGLKVDGCETGFSFASLSLGVPLATLSTFGTARVTLSPYLIWGDNIIAPTGPASDAADNSVAPGGRLSINLPATEAVSFNVYASYDQVYGTKVGGGVGYRIPFGGFVHDPNLSTARRLAVQPVQNWMVPSTAGDQLKEGLDTSDTQIPDSAVRIRQGQKARFDPDGDLLELSELSTSEVRSIILTNLNGQDPLPESRLVAIYAASIGIMSQEVASVTGQDFVNSAKVPVSVSVDAPFDVDRPPTANYACEASKEAQDYIVDEALRDGREKAAKKAASADRLYLGKPDADFDGWPVTRDPQKAYRFASGGQCQRYANQIERDKRYSGPSNPLVAIELKGASPRAPQGNVLQQEN